MSERAVQGVVANVSWRDFPDRNSGENIKLHSFQIQGSNQWFRTGRFPLPFGVGQTIKFVADGQNVDVRSVQTATDVVARAPSVAPATVAAPPASRGSGKYASNTASKDEYWANKEAHDREKEQRYQQVAEPRMALSVATEAAARIVAAAFQTDALSFGNATKAKKLGMIIDATKEVATELAAFIHDAPNVLASASESKQETSRNNAGEQEETNE
jgi:hypothetical protein